MSRTTGSSGGQVIVELVREDPPPTLTGADPALYAALRSLKDPDKIGEWWRVATFTGASSAYGKAGRLKAVPEFGQYEFRSIKGKADDDPEGSRLYARVAKESEDEIARRRARAGGAV